MRGDTQSRLKERVTAVTSEYVQLVNDAHSLISAAGQEVLLDNKKVQSIKFKKLLELEHVVGNATSNIYETENALQLQITEKYAKPQLLQLEFTNHFGRMNEHRQNFIGQMMNVRAKVCVECITPHFVPYRQLSGFQRFFLMPLQSMCTSAEDRFYALCGQYAVIYGLDAIKKALLENTIIPMADDLLQKIANCADQNALLSTACTVAYEKTKSSIDTAHFCAQPTYLSSSVNNILVVLKNRYDYYKNKIAEAEDGFLTDLKAVSLMY